MENVEIMAVVETIKGCEFGSIVYVADCGFTKKSGFFGVRKKVVAEGIQLNYNYENAVNNRLEKQGDERVFEAQSLPWGHWVEGFENLLISHKGALYLRFYTQKRTRYAVTYFESDGTECSAERVAAIKEYLKSKEKPIVGTQAAAGLVENQVSPKAVAVVNIKKVVVNHNVYGESETTLQDAE